MTTKDQKLALDHLWYESWMLQKSFEKLKEESNQLEFNIFIEIYLIHVRNLIYFLEDKKDKRDIRCSDFGIKKKIIDLPQSNNLRQIDKFVSHLTWDRINEKKPEWSPEIIYKIKITVHKEIANFIIKLPDDLFPTLRYDRTKNDFINLSQNS